MPEIIRENPYAPVAKMGENLLVFTRSKWKGYTIDYQEALPLGSTSVIDFGALAASGTIASTIVTALALDDGYLAELWMRPLDDIEIVLWLLQGQQRFRIKNVQFRVSLLTGLVDPMWLSTRFAVLGSDLDPYLEIRNPAAYALASTQVAIWGNKYLLKDVDKAIEQQMISGARPASRIVAEGRMA